LLTVVFLGISGPLPVSVKNEVETRRFRTTRDTIESRGWNRALGILGAPHCFLMLYQDYLLHASAFAELSKQRFSKQIDQ